MAPHVDVTFLSRRGWDLEERLCLSFMVQRELKQKGVQCRRGREIDGKREGGMFVVGNPLKRGNTSTHTCIYTHAGAKTWRAETRPREERAALCKLQVWFLCVCPRLKVAEEAGWRCSQGKEEGMCGTGVKGLECSSFNQVCIIIIRAILVPVRKPWFFSLLSFILNPKFRWCWRDWDSHTHT